MSTSKLYCATYPYVDDRRKSLKKTCSGPEIDASHVPLAEGVEICLLAFYPGFAIKAHQSNRIQLRLGHPGR